MLRAMTVRATCFFIGLRSEKIRQQSVFRSAVCDFCERYEKDDAENYEYAYDCGKNDRQDFNFFALGNPAPHEAPERNRARYGLTYIAEQCERNGHYKRKTLQRIALRDFKIIRRHDVGENATRKSKNQKNRSYDKTSFFS